METSHYPSFELSKKLTEIGFPKTEKYWDRHATEKIVNGYGITSDGEYVCPNVMEMLDVIPEFINVNGDDWMLYMNKEGRVYYQYQFGVNNRTLYGDSLPNALAEMVLYLHDNGFVKFK